MCFATFSPDSTMIEQHGNTIPHFFCYRLGCKSQQTQSTKTSMWQKETTDSYLTGHTPKIHEFDELHKCKSNAPFWKPHSVNLNRMNEIHSIHQPSLNLMKSVVSANGTALVWFSWQAPWFPSSWQLAVTSWIHISTIVSSSGGPWTL